MDKDDEDPEAKADLELRERIARERPAASLDRYNWKRPADVEHWPCTRCGTMVGVPQEGVDAAKVFDDELRRRGEAPLARTKIMWCHPCAVKKDEYGATLNRKQVDNLATVIRELKETPGPGPDRERELLKQAGYLSHPDVVGLTLWLTERRERQGNAKPGKRRF